MPNTELIKPTDLEAIIRPKVQDIFREGDFEYQLAEDRISQAAAITIRDSRTGQKWLHFQLRDRFQDGDGWQKSILNTWPKNHPDDTYRPTGEIGVAVEESKYWLHPDQPTTAYFAPEEAMFIENPFEALPKEITPDSVTDWFRRWRDLVIDRCDDIPYPGFYSMKSIEGLTHHVLDQTIVLLRERGYYEITSIPTWYHIAKMYEHHDFEYVYKQDEAVMNELSYKVNKLEMALDLNKTRQRVIGSWTVVLQFLNELIEKEGGRAEDFVPRDFVLRGENGHILTYPLTTGRNLWMARSV